MYLVSMHYQCSRVWLNACPAGCDSMLAQHGVAQLVATFTSAEYAEQDFGEWWKVDGEYLQEFGTCALNAECGAAGRVCM